MINDLLTTTLTPEDLIDRYTLGDAPDDVTATPLVPYLGLSDLLTHLAQAATDAPDIDEPFTYTPGEDTMVVATLDPELAQWLATQQPHPDEDDVPTMGLSDVTPDDWDAFLSATKAATGQARVVFVTMT